jgi:ribosomal protein S19E (S16A)
MAAKFIDRLYFLFTGKIEKESDDRQEDWIPARVADIRRRIADLESRIGRTKEPNSNPQVQRPAAPVHERRNEELDAIKAKLLGKK